MTNIVDERGARTALGLGVGAFIAAWLIPFAGIILGAISLNIGKRANASDHKTWAILGIVINAVGTVLLMLLVAGGIAAFIFLQPELEACNQAMKMGSGKCFLFSWD